MTAYTASKAAVAAFTVALAEELKNDDISAIALAPSTIDTPANRKDMPTAKHDTWVKPTAIAELIVAHCSLSETINSGAVMPVYGRPESSGSAGLWPAHDHDAGRRPALRSQ